MNQTPIEYLPSHGIWLKRDDLYSFAGVNGGKVRTCRHLATRPGIVGLVTAGSRHSPQVEIVAHVAAELGLWCRAHVPAGPTTPELESAVSVGAELVTHRPGYNSVIVSRARADYLERSSRTFPWAEIPFGMECEEATIQTASQVADLPDEVQRIVVPVGSGMSLAGVLRGLVENERTDLAVVGVVVGADPTKRLERYAPLGWQPMLTLRTSAIAYSQPATNTRIAPGIGPELDPIYEAKCLPYLAPGDLFWIVGARRATARR